MTGEPQPRGADAELAAALDALIPGANGWPRASQGVSPQAILARLSADDRKWVLSLVTGAADGWQEAWSQAEAGEPARFRRFLAVLYDAYYRAECVERRLREIAEAGPRDPCRAFDPSLLT